MVIAKALFYADGSIVECPDGDEVEVCFKFRVSRTYLRAPSHGIQAIVQSDRYVCRTILRGEDHYYALPSGLIHAADNLIPYLEQYLPGLIKHGVCIGTDEWESMCRTLDNYDAIPAHGPNRKPRPDAKLK